MCRELVVNGSEVYHIRRSPGPWGTVIRKRWGQADLSHRQNFQVLTVRMERDGKDLQLQTTSFTQKPQRLESHFQGMFSGICPVLCELPDGLAH